MHEIIRRFLSTTCLASSDAKHINICCEYAEMVLVSGGWETLDYGLVHVILLSGFDEKQGQPTTKWRNFP